MIFFVVLFFIFKAGPQSVESLLVLVKYWTKRRNHVVLFDDQGEKKSKTLYSTLEDNAGLSRRPSDALGNELMSRGSGTF